MAEQSYRLVVQKGPNAGKTYDLTQDEITIGRDVTSQIVISDPEVSRKHARLQAQPGGYVVMDAGSTNGTFVGGQRLMGPHLLRHGETIMLGEKVSLLFEEITFDADATLVGAGAVQVPPPQPRETYRVAPPAYSLEPEPEAPSLDYSPSYVPAYSGQVPPGPAEAYPPLEESYAEPLEEEPKKVSRTWIYVGCGCLVLLALCCIVGGFIYDAMDLYCQTPFIDQFLNCP